MAGTGAARGWGHANGGGWAGEREGCKALINKMGNFEVTFFTLP